MNSRYNDGCAFPFTSASVHTIYFYCFAIYKEKRLLKRKKHNFKLNLIRHALKEIRLLSQKKTPLIPRLTTDQNFATMEKLWQIGPFKG